MTNIGQDDLKGLAGLANMKPGPQCTSWPKPITHKGLAVWASLNIMPKCHFQLGLYFQCLTLAKMIGRAWPAWPT